MKRQIRTIVLVSILLAFVGISVYAVTGNRTYFSIGASYRSAVDNPNDTVVATYKGHEILAAAVEHTKNTCIALDEKTMQKLSTERGVINYIIEDIILIEEAENRNIIVSESEIEDIVDAAKRSYDLPKGKTILDDFCAGAGITIEDYYNILRERAPRIILRQKLKDEIGREFCEEHGIKFTKENPPTEMIEAIEKYIENLFLENSEFITYYVK